MVPSAPPPLPDPARVPRDEETLEALAAGELPPGEAEALRGLIAADPALAARYARVVAVEEALTAEALLALPPDLVDEILAALPQGRRLVLAPLARMAAAVLLAFTAWLTSAGAVPALAAAAPVDIVGETLEPTIRLLPVPAIEAPQAALGEAGVPTDAWSPLLLGIVGVFLLAAGFLLAVRLSRTAVAHPPTETPS